ncbi:MAG: recombinase family protein [Pseudobdellovibrionaceae bacterium]
MKTPSNFIYFKYSQEENPQKRHEQLEMQMHSLGIPDAKFLFDKRNEASNAFNILVNKIDSGDVGMVIVPSLDHFEDLVSDSNALLLFLSNLAKKRVQFLAIDDALKIDDSVYSFLPKLITAIKKAKSVLKSARIRQAKLEARKSDDYVGPKKRRDDEKIRSLRQQGFSIREIAKQLGISTWPVQESLKHRVLGDDISV